MGSLQQDEEPLSERGPCWSSSLWSPQHASSHPKSDELRGFFLQNPTFFLTPGPTGSPGDARGCQPQRELPQNLPGAWQKEPGRGHGAGPDLPLADPKITEPTTQPGPSTPLVLAADAEEHPKGRFPRGVTTSRGAWSQFSWGGIAPFTSVPQFPPPARRDPQGFGGLPPSPGPTGLEAEPQTWPGLVLAASTGSSPAAAVTDSS